ncbi:hypothetical protein SPRG_15660 [Saprolegnia parasitica CBS 223.65]|uniref:Uncharacterized protein n=1 Tax=Saprolegnia parasitica (strain CBS 223.65) TaxID=695850 RepID=A0A067BXE8_SAPPC|nr:hypothetical protein SPRG_15660 [Saprolegnia parasitica CBS 223.65]KDO19217.1 hypothetical protein SPRG_15660 [Saprolegnia parasitica CBS 223.65]|eukprot:XP_012210083.1 hypothetical protein SPRG_15660 [Saprolegnia parasitica CBS 223.65]
MASLKRAASPPSAPAKRLCIASEVLTNPSLVGSITDFSTDCLAFCPTLYDVDELVHAGKSFLDRLCGKHVPNGYVDHAANLSKDELVARAKASVTNPKALYRALKVLQKLAEIVAPIDATYGGAASGMHDFDFCYMTPMLFAPSCRVDPTSTTWGRDDLVKIFDDDSLALSEGRGVPDGFGWHWYNLSEDGTCAFCATAGTVQESAELQYESDSSPASDTWRAVVEANGLHPYILRGWRSYAYHALLFNRDTHRDFCRNVVQPLRAHLRAHLRDVKIVRCFNASPREAATILGGISTDGYLVGLWFGAFDYNVYRYCAYMQEI